MKDLATLFPKKLQGFHWTLLYHCYTLHSATRYNALQHTATHCSALYHMNITNSVIYRNATTTLCNTLQRTATHCNTLQHTAAHSITWTSPTLSSTEMPLQHSATHYNALQHTATRCNTPQHTLSHEHHQLCHLQTWRWLTQGGQHAQDALSCRSHPTKEPPILGLFCGKYPRKTRYPMGLGHPVRV